jgi:two-component system chemotaxis sensor kinase CheA
MDNNIAQISNRLNHCLSLLFTANQKDLTNLGGIHQELEQIKNSNYVKEDIKKWAERTSALTESIILGETEFKSGVSRLSATISDVLESLNEALKSGDNYKISESKVEEQENLEGKNEISKEELREIRKQFARNQNEVLEKLEASILEMAKGSIDAKNEILRILHTLKGEFEVCGLLEYSQAIHSLEDIMQGKIIPTSNLLAFKDGLQKSIEYACSCGEFLAPPSIPIKSTNIDEEKDKSKDTRIKIDIGHIEDKLLLSEFLNESIDLIHNGEVALLDLETSPDNIEAINTVFRACHTIKGSAGFLQLTHIQKLSHAMEDLLSKARDKTIPLTTQGIDLLLHSMDILKELIYGVKKSSEGEECFIPECFDELIKELKQGYFIKEDKSLQNNAPVSAPVGEILLKQGVVTAQKLESALEKQKTGDTRKIGEILIEDEGVKAREIGKALSLQKGKTGSITKDESIRIPVEKLDTLIDSIGEAVIAQSMLTEDLAVKSIKSHEFHKKVSRLAIIMRRIQELSMSLRMVSIKSTFQKMARIVRDICFKNGKKIVLKTEGEDTELDKSIIENIGDPLMHMVRNSCDHGIESPQERLACGKSETGTIVLRAYHRGGGIFIEIEDDGRGLNKEAILQKAIEKGLCRKDAHLTEQEIYQFIFLPGFSTAKTITDVSGRGVGMDVVKKNITQLRGSVDIHSTPGKGTKFVIRLPLTLAIIDGLVVRASNERFIIPLLSVVECVAITKERVHGFINGHKMLKVRDEILPIINLRTVIDSSNEQFDKLAPLGIIIEDSLGGKTVVGVDSIESQQQVVIKSLGSGLGDIEGISGGAIMSDGSVSLILDASSIVRIARKK